mmetsp:Transcript_67142/g.165646  ORF Transcript_67142/g.165646 Transcript_67142/m.165646 type:complete len:178 (+) Transcript_67142:7648-8181(+)
MLPPLRAGLPSWRRSAKEKLSIWTMKSRRKRKRRGCRMRTKRMLAGKEEGDDWIQDNEPGRRVPVDAVTQDGAVDADAMTEEPRPSRTHHSRVDPIRNNDQRIESQDAQAKRPNERASALFRAGGMGWAAAVAVAGICLGSLLGAVALFSWRKRRAGGNQRSFEERYRMRTFADNDL